MADLPRLTDLMAAAIDRLQDAFLSPAQVVASRAIMGLDTQLVDDGTYLVAEIDGVFAGCGGWSRRATLYGGDHTGATRDPRLLDPKTEPAKIRAMYTHPDFARRGVGRRLLDACEQAAEAAGFREAELMSTLSGEPLYTTAGYEVVGRRIVMIEAVEVPLIAMTKTLRPPAQSPSG